MLGNRYDVTGLLHRPQVNIQVFNMATSLKTDFAQIFSRCPKTLSCPKFGGGGCSPPRPPGPYAYGEIVRWKSKWKQLASEKPSTLQDALCLTTKELYLQRHCYSNNCLDDASVDSHSKTII